MEDIQKEYIGRRPNQFKIEDNQNNKNGRLPKQFK